MLLKIASRNRIFAMVLCFFVAGRAVAADFDETTNGDLSGDRLAPTLLALSAGTNSVSANTGAFLGEEEVEFDQEYLRIDLPAGHQLSEIRLAAYESNDGTAFIGVQSGTIFTFDPDEALSNVGNLLGYTHFGPNDGHALGANLLPDIGSGAASIGFAPPLTGSSYTFWIQQTGASTDYQLDFIVTAIPEPASVILLAAALLGATTVRGGRCRIRQIV